MPSLTMHHSVSVIANRKLNLPEASFYLGTIAPDVINTEKKELNHFYEKLESGFKVPNIDLFITEYRESLSNPFVLGFLSHLLVDRYFFEEFIDKYIELNNRELVVNYLLNNELKTIPLREGFDLLYSEYDKLNKRLVEAYNLNKPEYYEEKSDITSKEDLEGIINKYSNILAQMHNQDGALVLFREKDILNFIKEAGNKVAEKITYIKNSLE